MVLVMVLLHLTGGIVVLDGASNNNLTINSSSNFYDLTIDNPTGEVNVTADLNVTGDLIINSNSTLDVGNANANLNIGGDFSNSGTFSSSGETLTFDGTGDNTCSPLGSASMDIIINKSSNGSLTF